MSLYKDASLVMIPSAYSDGRLYSIRPIPEFGSEILTQPVDISVDFTTNAGGVILDANTFQTFGGGLDGIKRDGFVVGKQYRIEIQGTTTSSGFTYGNGSGSGNEYGSGFGVSYFTALNQRLWIRQITAGTTDITTFSIKEVSNIGDFDFSRGSNLAATRVDVNGLIEKGRENLLLQSNQFDTTWVPNTGITLTSGQSGYDGSNDAWLLSKGAFTFQKLYQDVTASGLWTFSVYAKEGTLPKLTLRVNDDGTRAVFNLDDGSVYEFLDPSSKLVDYGSSDDLGSGWRRYHFTYNGSLTRIQVYPDFGEADAGNIYIQDAQLEAGLVATDYIETGASTAQAGILEDMPRLDYSGGASCPALLLEPQRTNLVVNSEYANSTNWSNGGTTYSNNQATSPEGVDNAIKLIEDNSTSFHYLGSDILGVTTAGTYSISGFIKKGTRRYGGIRAVTNGYVNRYFVLVDLDDGSVVDTHTQGSGVTWSYDVEDYGSGWYRLAISGAHTSGTIGGTFSPSDTDSPTYFGGLPDYDGSTGEHIFCYGLQAELGSYPTSYIPTMGASVTRSKDTGSLNLVGAGVNDGWTSGTILIEFEKPYNNENADVIRIHGNSVTGRAYIYNNGYGFASDWAYATNFTIGENNKIIYRLNTLSTANLFKNGVKLTGAEGSGTAWSDIKYIYLNNQGGAKINIKQIVVFPTALTDSECIALTS